MPQIDVTFQIDADGILNVTAKDKATGKSASIEIKETSRLTESEIERMRKDAEEHAEEDRRRVEEVETRNQADALLHTVEKTLGELGDKVPAAKRGEVEAAIRSLREKLDGRADTGAIRAGMEELRRLAGRWPRLPTRVQDRPPGPTMGARRRGRGTTSRTTRRIRSSRCPRTTTRPSV